MVYREAEHVRLLKERTRASISLAMEGRWEEAAQLNREILEACPDNIQALNRLGKALIELGHMEDALQAFELALEIEPENPIAAKHVARLKWAAEKGPSVNALSNGLPGLSVKMFTGDSGKSAEVVLLASDHAGHPSPGTPVSLERNGSTLAVLDATGVCLGLTPPKLAHRLIALMEGGNRYDGAVSGLTNGAARVVLREAHQDPSQRSKVSFPPASAPEPEPAQEAPASEWTESGPPIGEAPPVFSEEESQALELVRVGAALDGGLVDDLLLPELVDEDEPPLYPSP